MENVEAKYFHEDLHDDRGATDGSCIEVELEIRITVSSRINTEIMSDTTERFI